MRESVYAPSYDPGAELQLIAWQEMGITPGGRRFWIGTLDFVGSCDNLEAAREAFARSRARGFYPYAADGSAGLQTICFWPL